MNLMHYPRPPVTASFEDLRRRRLPQVLFVHFYLPEGVTVCDIKTFATMIEEAYRVPDMLHMGVDLDEDGNEQCRGIGNNGRWEWIVTRPARIARDGVRYTSIYHSIDRILISPEQDGRRRCVVQPDRGGRDHLLASRKPLTFTIRTGAGQAPR